MRSDPLEAEIAKCRAWSNPRTGRAQSAERGDIRGVHEAQSVGHGDIRGQHRTQGVECRAIYGRREREASNAEQSANGAER